MLGLLIRRFFFPSKQSCRLTAHRNTAISFFFVPLFQCKLAHVLRGDSFSGHLESFLGTVWSAFAYVMEQSYVSFTGVLMLLITAITFVPSKVSLKKRVVIGVLHVAAHLMAALILMLMLELGIEICIQHNLLANSGQCPFHIPLVGFSYQSALFYLHTELPS